MKTKIQTLLGQLNHGLVEREAAIRSALLAVLAGENLVLVGPPGTGKSLIARRIADSVDAGSEGYFEYLLTKFSTPEEIFGPLSITELKADRFRRNTAGYLPAVKLAFLDEVFKASSSILNALLTILNERVYHNGAEAQQVPLRALIAASNELPVGQEELSALYDRFLMRSFVDYVSQDGLSRLFDPESAAPAPSRLSADDLDTIQRVAQDVAIPPHIAEAVQRIWIQHKATFKEDNRESLSDRRLKKVIKLLRVSAATNGRREVDLSDVVLLKDCLWNHQENAIKVRDLILNVLRGLSHAVPSDGSVETVAPSGAAVVKGLTGSGTEHDPLLIKDMHDFARLERPEIGTQGYYFRQTADIDCSRLSNWLDIKLQGHYDGGGHTIKYKKTQDDHECAFSRIQAGSSVLNLKLENLSLARNIEDSSVARCQSTVALIAGDAKKCSFKYCESRWTLILGEAAACTITDSIVNLQLQVHDGVDRKAITGIAGFLSTKSTIERCFVYGRIKNDASGKCILRGFAQTRDSATIKSCALGKLDIAHLAPFMVVNGIASRISDDPLKTTLKNNASIAHNHGEDDIDGGDGKTVDAALFNRSYFEHALGWDFDAVWQWNPGANQPALRPALAGRAQVAAAEGMADLLTQQVKANIWL